MRRACGLQSLPSDSCHSGKRKRGQDPRTCQLTPPEPEYPPGILPAHKDRFRVCLKNWTTRMAGMQPKCKFGDELYDRSLLLLFRCGAPLPGNGVRQFVLQRRANASVQFGLLCVWMSIARRNIKKKRRKFGVAVFNFLEGGSAENVHLLTYTFWPLRPHTDTGMAAIQLSSFEHMVCIRASLGSLFRERFVSANACTMAIVYMGPKKRGT